jgi:TPR repeat protein
LPFALLDFRAQLGKIEEGPVFSPFSEGVEAMRFGIVMALVCAASAGAAATPRPNIDRTSALVHLAQKQPEPAAKRPAKGRTVDVGDPNGKAEFDDASIKAQAGDADAMGRLADYYERGWGVAKSPAQVRIWQQRQFDRYLKAAEQDDLDAITQIANRYEYGNAAIDIDLKKSVIWKQRYKDVVTRKAEAGDADAMVLLAEWLDGEDGGSDHAAAVVWWKAAAAAGNFKAMETLGDKYDEGTDVPADRAQAFAWYLKASKDPTDRWRAHRELAHKYKTGDGVAKNLEEAARHHVELAENYGGWRRRMGAPGFVNDVARGEVGYRTAVQRELGTRGLYKGPIDGTMSKALEEAITAVWRRNVKDE